MGTQNNIQVSGRQSPWKETSVVVAVPLLEKVLLRKINHYGAELVQCPKFTAYGGAKLNHGLITFMVHSKHEKSIHIDLREFINGFLACYTLMTKR